MKSTGPPPVNAGGGLTCLGISCRGGNFLFIARVSRCKPTGVNTSNLKRAYRTSVLMLPLMLSGCVIIPPKVQITDVASGKKFTTYDGEPYSKENMLGYNFRDLDSGEMVMLKSYSKKTIEEGHVAGVGSPELAAFNDSLRTTKP